jgi:hypothetical protein
VWDEKGDLFADSYSVWVVGGTFVSQILNLWVNDVRKI